MTHGRELAVVGIDHTTADIALRERVAFADAEIAPALVRLAGQAGGPLEQAAILSTCNRVELYAVVRSRLEPDELATLLARHHELDRESSAARCTSIAVTRWRSATRLVLIDLALPRDIDPAVALLPGVEVYTLDDLRGLVEGTLQRRRAELPAAHAVLRSEVSRFTTWLSRRQPATA